MKNTQRKNWQMASLCLATTLVFLTNARQLPNIGNNPSVRLRLTIPNPAVTVGEGLGVRVELKNESGETIVIARWLGCVTNAPAFLCLEFRDEKGQRLPSYAVRADMTSAEFEGDSWTQIAAGYFYGNEFTLRDLPYERYEFLNKLGRYSVTAKYVSKGGFIPASGQDWKIPKRDAWVGEVDSNAASFEVIPKQK
jgi:hypothetical protein